MNRIAVTGPVLLALVVGTIYAQKKEDAGAVYKEPKEAFEAAKKAVKDRDYKGYYKVLTPQSRELFTAQVALLAVAMKDAADTEKGTEKGEGPIRKKLKPILDVMNQHGLTNDYVKKLKRFDPKADAKEREKTFKEVIKPIKSHPDFLQDILTKMHEALPKGSSGLKEMAKDTLEDVKVEGDKATATAVGERPGKKDKVKTPLKFEKIKGSWHLVLPAPAKGKETDD